MRRDDGCREKEPRRGLKASFVVLPGKGEERSKVEFGELEIGVCDMSNKKKREDKYIKCMSQNPEPKSVTKVPEPPD